MEKTRKIFAEILKNRWLLAILVIAFLIRVIGVQYALPFRTNLDELGPVNSALKMIELKTLIPSLHSGIFNYLLTYPPYMSYTYIPFFLIFLVIKFFQFLFIGGNFTDIEMFKLFLLGDRSVFFIIARAVSALFGTATVFLVYKTAKNIFNKEKIALFSATFLSFSFLHVSFSHVARHWIYVTFFFALVMYVLSCRDDPVYRRYILAFGLAGIGMGYNYQIGLSVFFIALWFIFYDKLIYQAGKFSLGFFKKPWLYKALGFFFVFSALAMALHPHTTGLDDSTLGVDWGLTGLLKTYNFYLEQMFGVEFLFLFFVLVGFIVSLFKNRGFFSFSFGFPLIYVMFFYFYYHQLDVGRYILMLYPLFAITAGYGLYIFNKTLLKVMPKLTVYILTFLVFFSSFIMSAKYDYLLVRKDTRVQALEWINETVSPDARIVTFVQFMRLPATMEASTEQAKIDPLSVSHSDKAISMLPQKFYSSPRHYVINLYTVDGPNHEDFISNVKQYIEDNHFDYLVYDQNSFMIDQKNLVDLLKIEGETVRVFDGYKISIKKAVVGFWFGDDINNDFAGGLWDILRSKNNGPTIVIKKLSSM